MQFRWSLASAQPLLAADLARELGVSPIVAQCLLNRQVLDAASAKSFLSPRLRQLADPFLLPEMDLAVARLFRAREARETVVVFGDYDVDGVTATALLLETLRALGWTVEAYVPHRLDEGYGLTSEAAENCLRKFPNVSVLLAVDCGSTAGATIRALQERGVDVLVLDHHLAPEPASPVALVNPHCRGHGPAFRELCSVGLAFKLAHALVKQGRANGIPEAADYDVRTLLDLVALGTVADMVPLTGENRLLVSAGLQRLNSTPRHGLVALKSVAGCKAELGVSDVGFQLGPRLNASGRLETANDSLRLLTTGCPEEARTLAEQLDRQNAERQRIERSIAETAIAGLRERFNPEQDFAIVEGQSPWHIGVVGIVASRVLSQFYRPTIIVGGDGAEWRGSGRSIAGFDLAAALRECDDLLVRHGGHSMAAGVSIRPENLEAFRTRLNSIARRNLTSDLLKPELRLDGVVSLGTITRGLVTELDGLKPMGQGNPSVVFCAERVRHGRPPQRLGREKQHVKLWVVDGPVTHEAVWWSAASKPMPEGSFDLAFTPQENHYNGSTTIQLKVLDWRPASPVARP